MNQRIGPNYPYFELARALAGGNETKAAKWREVLAGMATGDLSIGSRTPVSGMPAWATPEVVRGGFATGAYAAGGDLRPHETILVDELGIDHRDTGRIRAALNAWHLTEDGIKRLTDMAASGCFDAESPEETALLVVALLAEVRPAAAEAILDDILPFFDRLRFFPIPTKRPRGDGVHVRSVGELRQALARIEPSRQVQQQNASLTTWIPLYDRLVDLLGEPSGGSWTDRAGAWKRDYDRADQRHMSRRWRRADGPFQRCRRLLDERLTGRDLSQSDENYIALVANRRAAKYGVGTERDAYRADQARQNIKVWFDALAAVLLKRLEGLEDEAGLEDIDAVLAPVKREESRKGARTCTDLAPTFVRKIRAAHVAPVADLIEGGQITSPEVLAAVLPQITSRVHASGLAGRSERAVFATLYRAFRQRRSLLLLDLQSQVRLDELPWAAELQAQRGTVLDAELVAREVLHEIVTLTLTHFPHVQFPNALIEELVQLARRAKLDIPFTREVAADIFMGRFTDTFTRAAEICLARYHGTLYGRYFDLPERLPRMGLGAYCRKRAGRRAMANWSVAGNGTVIEQQLVLTSHNLAAVFGALDLSHLNHAMLAKRAFEWLCARQQIQYLDWRARLQMLKNTAYAWRQMTAFLSELDDKAQSDAWLEIEAIFSNQPSAFQRRFEPAMLGMREALQGIPRDHRKGMTFLGWSVGHHPFAPANSVASRRSQ